MLVGAEAADLLKKPHQRQAGVIGQFFRNEVA
jgi:hypothetical protein